MTRPSFALLLIAALVASCHVQSAPDDKAAALIAQWSGPYGGGDIATTRVMRSTAEWEELWRQLERERPRALDPAREMAVVIALGEKRTGGYSVEVIAARVEEGKLVIELRESTPAPGMMVTQALTAPWAVAVVSRSNLPVVFRKLAAAPPARHDR